MLFLACKLLTCKDIKGDRCNSLRPSFGHYAFCVSVLVLAYMIIRFLLLSNTAKCAIYPGQNWVFTTKMSHEFNEPW